jgi:DNA primase
MASLQTARQRTGDYYVDTVLPALAGRLDTAFPEFGWKRDARGWVATNDEMTHRVLGVRAQRVVAHGAAPPGFLVHGGDSTLWTAYLNGGVVPRGETFRAVVEELAARAGVDLAPVERVHDRDRRGDLLTNFFALCRKELHGIEGASARSYLERRGLPPSALADIDLGVVPNELVTRNALQASGHSELEIAQSGVLSDGRWPGRLCGAWRDEHGHIGTFWARSLRDSDSSTRYLYLRGASRSGLPPYGISDVLRLPATERREVVLVEGLLDVHHLRANGFPAIAAIGGARAPSSVGPRLHRLGFDSIVLALDNDAPGREGVARAVDEMSRATAGPVLRVLEPRHLRDAKDPDAFVREHGIDAFRDKVAQAECGITWRALDLTDGVSDLDPAPTRRAALARAGAWLGTLPARHSLEQEDAIRLVAERCGYSTAAVERAFRARFWDRGDRTTRGRWGMER